MRSTRAVMLGFAVAASACSAREKEGAEEAQREAEAEHQAKVAAGAPAKVQRPPVPGEVKIPCSQLIADPAAFQTALGESEPLTVKDVTRTETDATASCSLIRGGKRPTEAEQRAKLKREARLGVLPGDEICNVSARCSTIEDAERFRTKCESLKNQHDESMGTYACVQVVAQGAADVHVFRFLDADTRCILQVRGGPSQSDNALIRACATTARDAITPASIAASAEPTGAGANRPGSGR